MGWLTGWSAAGPIGENSNVQDGTVIHTDPGVPVRILDPKCVGKTFPDYFEAFFELVCGEPADIPVITVDVDGIRYLVSTRGESEWVRNVRANPTVTLATKVGTARFTATEVPVPQRDPVLTAYRAKAGKTVDGYFAKLPDPADHPVFSLTPV